MKQVILNTVTACFVFLAILMLAGAAGMMDQGAEIFTCIKLMAGSILALIAGAGFAEWRRI